MKDPTDLPPSHRPAVIQLVDGRERYVAHQRVTEQGWLWCVDWDGTCRKVPPQRIAHVETVETQMKGDIGGREWKEIVEDDVLRVVSEGLRKRAMVNGGERA